MHQFNGLFDLCLKNCRTTDLSGLVLHTLDVDGVIIWCQREPKDMVTKIYDSVQKYVSKKNVPCCILASFDYDMVPDLQKAYNFMYSQNEVILPVYHANKYTDKKNMIRKVIKYFDKVAAPEPVVEKFPIPEPVVEKISPSLDELNKLCESCNYPTADEV
jgi:hypothetical protein